MKLQDDNRSISLKIPAKVQFLPLAQNCVEKTGEILGLSGMKLMKLSLAVEEIFLHLVRVAGENKTVSLHITPGAISVIVQFDLRSDSLNLKAMNIVSSDIQSMLDQEDFSQMGLLLAATSIDSFLLEHTTSQHYSLILKQEKEYPEITASTFSRISATLPFVLDASPSTHTLQQACIQALAIYPGQAYSRTFQQPGRFADLVQGGELTAIVLKDRRGAICGFMVWEEKEEKSVSFNGPYIFTENDREEAARTLVDAFIGHIARSPAIIAFTHQSTDLLPMEQFESLGTLRYCHPVDGCQSLHSCYRHLREDHGEAVWAHTDLVPFLQKEYSRLVLIRDIRETGDYEASTTNASLFGVQLDTANSLATMRPMLNGHDISENIRLHISNLKNHNFHNILCVIDLGVGWQAALCGALMEQGFTPQLLQPLTGKGDCIIFQHATTTP